MGGEPTSERKVIYQSQFLLLKATSLLLLFSPNCSEIFLYSVVCMSLYCHCLSHSVSVCFDFEKCVCEDTVV